MVNANPMKHELDEARRMIPEAPQHVVAIADNAALAALCERFRAREWLAVDTEFLREKTYYPQLCLAQIADAEQIALIDVFALSDPAPLVELLTAPHIRKVFHSAEQDLEVLYHHYGVLPEPLFDTQLAAPLLGLDDQMGYARMIEALLGRRLGKEHTRTDWSRRPLPAGALDYAADDVRYLAVAYRLLRDALAAAGRRDWLEADFAHMARPGRFEVHVEQAWRRLKGWPKLTLKNQQILAELAAWRERRAMAEDRPRRWILADAPLLSIAEQAPQTDTELADTAELPDGTLTRHAQALLACVSRGLARPAEPLDAHGGPPDGPTRRRIKAGMRALARAAEQADIPPSSIASRQDIADIVAGRRDGRLLRGWRAEVAGNEVLAAIERADA